MLLAIVAQMVTERISLHDLALIIGNQSGPPNNNRFRFQGNVIKVSRKRENSSIGMEVCSGEYATWPPLFPADSIPQPYENVCRL